MFEHIFILAVSIVLIVRGATLSTKYAVRLAESFHLSKFIVGLMVVAVISILPETFVAISSSLAGIPEFGLGTLFGSNVADLTLVFAMVIAVSGRGIKIDKTILKNAAVYPFVFLVPLAMGLNGHFSRMEGVALILLGLVFYYFELRDNKNNEKAEKRHKEQPYKNALLLLLGMALLLVGAHFTVDSASELALLAGVSPVLIGMLIVGIGTTIPELLFSLKAVRNHDGPLAVGDILGTVLADATIVVGILAVISPFEFPQTIIYVTGAFMLVASVVLTYFMRSGRVLSKKEGALLLIFWAIFAITEYLIAQ